MSDWVKVLGGGDRRSIGQANRVVRAVLADRRRLAALIGGIRSNDVLISMRCADVAEKVSCVHPEWLSPYRRTLLGVARTATRKELRWHLAQILPRLALGPREKGRAIELMTEYLTDKSSIVQVFALQALADFSVRNVALRRRLRPILDRLGTAGSAAVRNRARRIIEQLE